MKREILVDSCSIISLSNVCFLDVFRFIKERNDVHFLITPWIKEEIVDNAVKTKRFKISGIRIAKLIKEGILEEVGNSRIREYALELLNLSNSIYSIDKNPIRAFNKGELELLAASKILNIKSLATDEKILRFLLEEPTKLKEVMSYRSRKNVEYDSEKQKHFMKKIGIKYLMRSTEIVAYAFSKGFFDKYENLFERSKEESLAGLMWSLKMNGCAITRKEIAEYMSMMSSK